MRKFWILTVLACILSNGIFAQVCIDDVWMCLKNNQAGKAKKLIDECMIGNEANAEAWLMKGNVYLQIYQRDVERLKKEPTYVSKDTNAAWIANESFYKALELDNKIEPKTGMLGPLDGQILCAGPLYTIGEKAKKENRLEEAVQYLTVAARNLKLDRNNPNMSTDVGYIYYDLAVLSNKLKNSANYKSFLQDAINIKTPIPEIYLMMYDLYKTEKDTVNCGKILVTAKKVVPPKFQADIKATELDYYAMSGEIDKLNETCDKMAEEYATEPAVLNIIAGHLVNNGQYEKAEIIINKGLTIEPNNFDLTQQMGYRYFFDAIKYEDLRDLAMKEKDYTKANELKDTQKVVLEKAHTWVEKAYNINKNDKQNNIMLQQIKVKLLKPVPEDLKARVDSYKSQK